VCTAASSQHPRLPTLHHSSLPTPPLPTVQFPGRRPPPHDLECAHILLAGAGPKLDGSSEDNRRAMDAYCRVLEAVLAQGESMHACRVCLPKRRVASALAATRLCYLIWCACGPLLPAG